MFVSIFGIGMDVSGMAFGALLLPLFYREPRRSLKRFGLAFASFDHEGVSHVSSRNRVATGASLHPGQPINARAQVERSVDDVCDLVAT